MSVIAFPNMCEDLDGVPDGLKVAIALSESAPNLNKIGDFGDRIVVDFCEETGNLVVAVLDSAGGYASSAAADSLAYAFDANKDFLDTLAGVRRDLINQRPAEAQDGHSTTATSVAAVRINNGEMTGMILVGDASVRTPNGRHETGWQPYGWNGRNMVERYYKYSHVMCNPPLVTDNPENDTTPVYADDEGGRADGFLVKKVELFETFDSLYLSSDWLMKNFSPDQFEQIVELCENDVSNVVKSFHIFHKQMKTRGALPDNAVFRYMKSLFKERSYLDDDMSLIGIKKIDSGQ